MEKERICEAEIMQRGAKKRMEGRLSEKSMIFGGRERERAKREGDK